MAALELLSSLVGQPELLPDIIFLDLHLPEFSGLQFLHSWIRIWWNTYAFTLFRGQKACRISSTAACPSL